MKSNVKLVFLSLAILMVLAACGPADIGFSNVIIKNDNAQAIKKIEIDSIEVTDNTGGPITIDAGDRLELYLEFITEENHEIKATYADDTTETITDDLSVNTNSTNTITFGVEPPDYSHLSLENDTEDSIIGVYLYEEETETPGDDSNFAFVKVPNFFGGGIAQGSSFTMDFTGEGTYYVYTGNSDYVYTLQGSVTLVYDTTVNLTASN